LALTNFDDDVLTIPLKHSHLRNGVANRYVVKLIPANYLSVDMWRPLPGDALRAAGTINNEVEWRGHLGVPTPQQQSKE
jgi:hypothetical protein